MTVSVLVPYRSDGRHRDAAWAYVRSWWAREHPDWQVVVGRCPDGPWRKAAAVADALARSDGNVLVVADADVICDGVADAVRQVAQAAAAWAVPHRTVLRLTEAATGALLGGAGPDEAIRQGGLARGAYQGVAGGGMAVLTREVYGRVPLDPRFAGWGGEDASWALALDTLAGRHWRGLAPLVHLWHPSQRRLNAHVGSAASHALHVRYQYAARDPQTMAALVAEHAPARAGDLPSFRTGCGAV